MEFISKLAHDHKLKKKKYRSATQKFLDLNPFLKISDENKGI